MENILLKIRRKRNCFNENLKRKLDNLTPRTKLNSILIALLMYGVLTIIMLISAFEKNNNTISIQHIEPTPLIDAPMRILSEKDSIMTDKLE